MERSASRSASQRRSDAIRRRFDVRVRRSEIERRQLTAQQRRRRLIAAVATLVMFGAIAGVAQVSSAGTGRWPWRSAPKPCPTTAAPPAPASPSAAPAPSAPAEPSAAPSAGASADADPLSAENIAAHNHTDVNNVGDGQVAGGTLFHRRGGSGTCTTPTAPAPAPTASGIVLGPTDCSDSNLPSHTGFQIAPACVGTAFGAVPAQENSPSLLIVRAPNRVAANTPFSWTFVTDNLEKSEFLPAAQGGYFAQPARLNGNGIVKGHVHSGCYLLSSTRRAPNGADRATFFLATEDNLGAEGDPSFVTINVPGLAAGTYRCISWAGTGSHGIPVNMFANQAPAVDAFRLVVG